MQNQETISFGSELTIHLKNLHFFAYHGLYDLEKKNGNEFELDVAISFRHAEGIIRHIDDTINYASVYEIINVEMQKPRELLETFLDELAQLLKSSFPRILNVDLTLYKLTAPIEELKGKVGVQLRRDFI